MEGRPFSGPTIGEDFLLTALGLGGVEGGFFDGAKNGAQTFTRRGPVSGLTAEHLRRRLNWVQER